ncbi:putative transcriptional regulator [Parvibaculum indicum]|uniref:XRE family transcriptional regulator n=1 Tax=Parvibaculum indicum TaxID=562969 RepID=UPI001422879F|nr:XRE family transcriptional regulator [Parvibaculum indicum]NIJ41428.1 putative transcriptional regulator [Parvibaculum indicum]
MAKKNIHLGSSLDDLLEEEGLLAEAQAIAIKRVLAWKLAEAMKEENLTKSALAKTMNTSRSALDRLLDPDNPSVTLLTMEKAAAAIGKTLRVELIDGPA